MDKILVAPSTDPVKDIDGLIKYAKEIQDNADLLHCDVMDGVFVERKTISYDVVDKLKRNCLLPLDVHLMVDKPWEKLDNYISAGANIITVHYEAFSNVDELLQSVLYIKEQGCLAGVSIKPNTDVIKIEKVLKFVDLVLVMSVEPGKSGQTFMESSLEKIKTLYEYREKNALNYYIEVDGGINNSNIKSIKESGADIVVSGNYVYGNTNHIDAINSLKM